MSDFQGMAELTASPFGSPPPEAEAALLGEAPPRSADGWDDDEVAPGDFCAADEYVANAGYEPAAMFMLTPHGTDLTIPFSGVPLTFQPDVPDTNATLRDDYGRRDGSLPDTGFGHRQTGTAGFGFASARSDFPSTSSF